MHHNDEWDLRQTLPTVLIMVKCVNYITTVTWHLEQTSLHTFVIPTTFPYDVIIKRSSEARTLTKYTMNCTCWHPLYGWRIFCWATGHVQEKSICWHLTCVCDFRAEDVCNYLGYMTRTGHERVSHSQCLVCSSSDGLHSTTRWPHSHCPLCVTMELSCILATWLLSLSHMIPCGIHRCHIYKDMTPVS